MIRYILVMLLAISNISVATIITHSHCPNHTRNNSDNMHTHDTSDPDHNAKHVSGHPHTWEFDEFCPEGYERDTSKKSRGFPTKTTPTDVKTETGGDTGDDTTTQPNQITQNRVARCGIGWQHPNPNIIIYAIEFAIDPNARGNIFEVTTVEFRADSDIENLDGYLLRIGILYNAGITYIPIPNNLTFEDGVLRITPEILKFKVGQALYSARKIPSFDYRLYTAAREPVDFAIACFLNSDVSIFSISEHQTARIIRKDFVGWDQPYLRYSWELETAPSAPSLKRTLIGTWASLKKAGL